MPSQTPKLKLNVFYENDLFDYEKFNENMQKLETCPICIKSDRTVANGAISTQVATDLTAAFNKTTTWHWRLYSDGTFEAWTKFSDPSVKCTDAAGFCWTSKTLQFKLPTQSNGNSFFNPTSYDMIQLSVSDFGSLIAPMNNTAPDTAQFLNCRIMGFTDETNAVGVYRDIMIYMKGACTING